MFFDFTISNVLEKIDNFSQRASSLAGGEGGGSSVNFKTSHPICFGEYF